MKAWKVIHWAFLAQVMRMITGVYGYAVPERRHVFNDDYLNWVKQNIRPLKYETKPSAIVHRWDHLREVASSVERPAAVMVTQTTVSRLEVLSLNMKSWKGPVSVAVYIEYVSGTPEAIACEWKTKEYIRKVAESMFSQEELDVKLFISISFLYARKKLLTSSCDVPGYESDLASSADSLHLETKNVLEDRQSPSLAIPQRLVNQFQRFLLDNRLRQDGEQTRETNQGAEAQSLSGTNPVFHFSHRDKHPVTMKVSEQPWKDTYDNFFPVNSLRNLAWGQVPRGAFVFLNDVDFIPSASLHEDLTNGKWRAELQNMREDFLVTQRRRALVLPAFERIGNNGGATAWPGTCSPKDGCETIQGVEIPRTFSMLREMLHVDHVVDVFHRPMVCPVLIRKNSRDSLTVHTMEDFGALTVEKNCNSWRFPTGHGCYSWMAWLQDETPKSMLRMDYAHPCEPYVIALSDALPRYDERFRGRNQNKVEQLTHMAMWGFEWHLLPAHFVVHVPHASTGRSRVWDEATMPLALTKIKMREIELEPEFRMRVAHNVPLPM